MTTTDMGKTWTEHPTSRQSLIEPRSCMASLISVDRERGTSKPDWLLFSNPNSTEGRKRITIKASPDGGATWPADRQLLIDEQPGRGYSCMTMIDENTVGILYEGSQSDLTFQRIRLSDITTPVPIKPEKEQELTTRHEKRTAETELTISRVFGDQMVLQADQPIRIWGTGRPGKPVVVTFAGPRVPLPPKTSSRR